MVKPLLILINGAPGTGKTTISRKLATDLKLPCLGKDDIKELLFERIETTTLERSKDVGAVSFEMLYAFIQGSLGRELDVIAECPFYFEFSHERIQKIIADTSAVCIEVYCQSDPAIRLQRFQERHARGERHPGHFDGHHSKSVDQEINEQIAKKYAPLALGPVITINTTEFSDEAYKRMLQELRDAIQYEGDAAKGANHA